MSKENNKTVETNDSVEAFLAGVQPDWKQADAREICALMEQLSGHPPKMWGKSIIGFGSYHYKYASGREGDSLRIGFSPRKQDITLYCMSGVKNNPELLERLGKHRTGKSCLYIKRLDQIDRGVLEEIFEADLQTMAERYPE